MRAPKAVFVDLDDTFLAPDKSIPAQNLALMSELAARGIELVPCTGRHLGGVPEELTGSPCVRHVVASNGGLVCDAHTGKNLHVEAIPAEEVAALYREVCDLPIVFDVFADGRAYVERDRFFRFDQIDVPDGLRAYIKAWRTKVDMTIPDLLPTVGPVTKVSLFFVGSHAEAALRAAIARHPGLHAIKTSNANLETMSVRATKGAGLLWLCDHMGWEAGEVVAFGDNDNDLTMLDAAGDGVAMENGTASAKAHADHVAPRAADGGVALYMREMLG